MDEQALIAYAAELYQHQLDREATWDGRQVTNAFQSAVALAAFNAPSHEQPELTTAHFQQICETSEKFDEYLFRLQGETIDDFAAGRQSRPGNVPGGESLMVPPNRSDPDSSSENEYSSDAESSGSDNPALRRGHLPRTYYHPPAPEASLPSPAAPPQPSGHPQTPQSPAFPFNVHGMPQTNPNSWAAQMQQPVVVPAGMLYAMQAQQAWQMPMQPLTQQQSQIPIRGPSPQIPAFNIFGYDQGQTQSNSHPPSMQPEQQHGNNLSVPNSGTTIHAPTNHIVPSFQQQYYQSDAQASPLYSGDATKSGKSRRKRPRESKRQGHHTGQGGRQTRQHGIEDEEGFWSRLKKDF